MEVHAGKLQVLAWLLVFWLSGVTSTKGGGKGKGGGLSAPLHLPAIAPPISPPHVHVNTFPVPLPPCAPITKYFTDVQLLDNYVPVYETQVQPVVGLTTFYHTNLIREQHQATSILYTTVLDTDYEYDTSEAVVTNYVTVTNVQRVPVITTVTSISLNLKPQVTTVTKIVKEGSPLYFTKTELVTRTVYHQPKFTVTEQFPYPFDNTKHHQVTKTHYVTATVEAKPRPPVTSTVVRTDFSVTPAFVTVTVVNTVAVTTTVRQPQLHTVKVEGPCSGGIRKGFGGNGKKSNGPY